MIRIEQIQLPYIGHRTPQEIIPFSVSLFRMFLWFFVFFVLFEFLDLCFLSFIYHVLLYFTFRTFVYISCIYSCYLA